MELMTLIAQTGVTAMIAVWMSVAVRSNWMLPVFNRSAVERVMRLELMEVEFPEEFPHVAHRRIDSPRVHAVVFRLIVLAETLAAVVLFVGALLLFLSIFGVGEVETARIVAASGLLIFSGIWAAFVTGGDHFAYWFSHASSQATHMTLVLWGFAGLILVLGVG